MKIALISLSIPTYNNRGAASALPYHLIKGMGNDAQFEVWSYNINHIPAEDICEVEQALGVKIHLLAMPSWVKWMFRWHLAPLRILLRYPYLRYCKLSQQTIGAISEYHPDKVWIYGEEIAHLAQHFPQLPCIATMPDCESMYYHRLLGKDFPTTKASSIMRYAYAFWQYRGMERAMLTPTTLYHFVGKADEAFFREICPQAKTVFLPHPLYAHRDKQIRFHRSKVKLLFAGRYDFYCSHGSDALLQAMTEHSATLAAHYEVTFLGKGWEQWTQRLQDAGWTAQHITFADDYIAELQQHDIQVNAIDVGTGTKGKVLDAISNGLLELGTPFALENIAVKHDEGCLLYHTPSEAIAMLEDIPQRIEHYEAVAEQGRKDVLAAHDASKVAHTLFLHGVINQFG